MDRTALEYTRAHYDRQAGRFESTKDALHARATGPSAPLKKFHNTIKRKLIDRFAHGADSLLDLACGRGGDIWKWFDSNLKYVKGIDLSPGEIAEARERYHEAKHKRPGSMTVCEFEDTPNLGLQEWKEPRLYDVVSCMFALHYFFVSETALKRFLQNVSINLRTGGYFIGTVPDGKRINACIRNSHVYSSPLLRIEARWTGAPSTFGSPYVCAIGDTVTGGEQGTEGSLEYLVYQNVLIAVAAQCGLKPVLSYDDPELEALFEPADTKNVLKHFAPCFPESDPSLERASALFTAFVFQKCDTNDRNDKDGADQKHNGGKNQPLSRKRKAEADIPPDGSIK